MTIPEPTMKTYTTTKIQPKTTEDQKKEDYPPLPKPSAPSKLSLYLGKRTSLSEEIKQQSPPTQPTLPSPYPIYTTTTPTPTDQNISTRRGPIRPPLTSTVIPPPPDDDPNPPPEPKTSTPQLQKLRRVTWGPSPTKDKISNPPISPIPCPVNPGQTTTQTHHPSHRPHDLEELQSITLSSQSNVSIHIPDTILSLSQQIDDAGAGGVQAKQSTPQYHEPMASMTKGSLKVNHDRTKTHPELSQNTNSNHRGVVLPSRSPQSASIGIFEVHHHPPALPPLSSPQSQDNPISPPLTFSFPHPSP
ncbi:hypothetical protein GBF38_000026 [Scomber scombrus]|uniref:Extensin-like n=1 Tax=Scomber scombrus TaxID=13677 RepID=A0AAV1N7C0_SCOSC